MKSKLPTRIGSLRLLFGFVLLLLTASSCLTVRKMNNALEQPLIDITIGRPIEKPFTGVSIPAHIEVDTVLYPSGFVPQSFATRTGFIVVPLLVYNRFQAGFLTTMGAKQFEGPINDAFKERFSTLLSSCEDSIRSSKDKKYTLSMDLQSVQLQGTYIHGSWIAMYGYGAASGTIDHGRNASSFVKIRWELSRDNEPTIAGNVTVTLKASYFGSVNGFLVNNGKRRELTKKELNFDIPYQTSVGLYPYLNAGHINKMAQVLCLSLDEASEMILKDIQDYFNDLSGKN